MPVATYRGDVEGDELGITLMHEHVFVVDPGLALNHAWYPGWDEDLAVEDAVARLDDLADAGVGTLVDMTVLGLGRMPHLVSRVAERTRLNVLGATGVYTLEHLPLYLRLRGPGAFFDEPDPMVTTFVRDLTVGMGESGVRAGVLKCVTDHPGLTPGTERALRAVARAHDAACHNDAFRAEDMAKAAPDHHYRFLLDTVVPLLREAGVSDVDIVRMLVQNPRHILCP